MNEILKKIAHPLKVDQIETLLEKHVDNFSFPLDILTKKLKESTSVQDLSIERLNATYRTKDSLTEGLSKELMVLSVSNTTTLTHSFCALSFDSAQSLMQIFENKEDSEVVVQDEFIVKEYCKYLSTLFLSSIKAIDLIEDFSLELSSAALPKKDCTCVDLELKSKDKSAKVRLIFEGPFLKEMSTKIKRKRDLLEQADDLVKAPLYLSTILDKTQLSSKQIDSLDIGDVILINTQFKPKENKGTFTLNLDNCPLAIARYKEGRIKILENIKNS
jgi:hypothetical protein